MLRQTTDARRLAKVRRVVCDAMGTHVADLPAPEPDLTVRYEAHADGIIDIYMPPEDAQRPAVLGVVIHGGYWRARWDRTHLRPFARALADRGIAVALPEYRRIGGGGEWPVIGQDIETALARARPLIAAAAPGLIDPAAPYRLIGHSAGGHLAMWAGLRAGRASCEHIVALAPVCDLYEAARQQLSDNAVAELLGGSPRERPAAYAEADPASYLPGDVPITLIHGAADDDVPVDLGRRIAAAHPEIRYTELPGADHFALIDPRTEIFHDIVCKSILGS